MLQEAQTETEEAGPVSVLTARSDRIGSMYGVGGRIRHEDIRGHGSAPVTDDQRDALDLGRGSNDPAVPAAGFGAIASTEGNIAYWKARNGITAKPVERSLDAAVARALSDAMPLGVIEYSWPGARGNELVWRKVVNGVHSLPGSEVIGLYDFLLRHARKR